ncbi:methylisocitrate lyase, partial [Burkholderia pseudomallei]
NMAALKFYETVRRDGTQKAEVPTMQTRAQLYDDLGYYAYEEKLDQLFNQGRN